MRAQLTGARVVVGFAFAAACLTYAGAVFANPEQPTHLYLATSSQTSTQVERFRMVGGVPERQPDLVYQNVGMPIAIGADGTFFATVPLSCCQGEAQINAYPPGSPNPSRNVVLPALSDTTVANALTIGNDGSMYVAYQAFISGDGLRLPAAPHSGPIPMHGIAVYPPGSNGGGPSIAYTFHGIQFGPVALEFGPEGHLYAAGYDYPRQGPTHGYIFDIARPWSGPNIVNVLSLGSVDAASIDFSDATRDMYVLDWTNQKILVFPRGAHGTQPPSRSMTIATHLGPSIAIAGANIFTSTFYSPSQLPEVVAYPKDGKGSPNQTFHRGIPGTTSLQGLVIGP